jgi:hypothetical protein
MMWSLMLPGSVDWMMKTVAWCIVSAVSAGEHVCEWDRTIFVSHTFTDADAALIVAVLQHHDLRQLNAQSIGDQLGEGAMAVTGQEFYRVGRHSNATLFCAVSAVSSGMLLLSW